jgi:hypothetical protein
MFVTVFFKIEKRLMNNEIFEKHFPKVIKKKGKKVAFI